MVKLGSGQSQALTTQKFTQRVERQLNTGVTTMLVFSFALARAIALDGQARGRFKFFKIKNSKPVSKAEPRRVPHKQKLSFFNPDVEGLGGG